MRIQQLDLTISHHTTHHLLIFLSNKLQATNYSFFSITTNTSVNMSAEYQGQDPLKLAQQAEQDLNSHAAKHGGAASDSGK